MSDDTLLKLIESQSPETGRVANLAGTAFRRHAEQLSDAELEAWPARGNRGQSERPRALSHKRLSKLETDVGLLKEDVSSLKTDGPVFKTDVSGLKVEAAIETKLSA